MLPHMGILPSGSAKAAPPSSTDSNVGALVQYDDDGAIILGVITGTKRDKLTVLNFRGREVELPRPRLYRLPAGASASGATVAAKTEALNLISQNIEREATELNVEELWSFVHEECRLYTVGELCQSYFGTDTAEKHAGLRIALIREKVHFKRDRDGFEPRSAQVVSDLRIAEEAKKKKVTARESTVACVVQRAKDPSSVIPRELEENFALMGEVAAGVAHTDQARQKEGKELVHLCAVALKVSENTPIEKQAFEVLVRSGYFTKDSNLSFIRHDIPTRYAQESLAEAEAFTVPATIADFPEEEQRLRRDFTQKHTFTIDDISTQDMDDAISIERTPEGYELGIHITDVAWAIAPESVLDREARRRATSLYCADKTVNMLPLPLSESKLSLRQGEVRPCISVVAQLSENFEIRDWTVVPSFIKVAQRYTYDDVDLLLEHEDETLMRVYQAATASEEERIRKGAVRVHRREVVPFVEPDGSIRLLEIDEESPARSLVAELMVLGNSLMAQFAVRNNLPAIFRGQERPDENARQALVDVPEGPAKDFTTRSKLKKSTTSFEPHYHAGLGLDAYIQATSPIRRYLDLCHQRQFLAFFKSQKPWITKSEFEPLASEVEVHINAANLASRETKRYWLLRYLEQRGRGAPIAGTIVRLDTKSPLVELDEIYITVFVKTNRPVRMGEQISMKVVSVDPQGDYVRLEAVA
jgi:exoribonuclease-2